MGFNTFRQLDQTDCGPTCLRMIAKHYGRNIPIEKLRLLSEKTREGTSLTNVAKAAEKIGFRTLGLKLSVQKLRNEAPLPCIVR